MSIIADLRIRSGELVLAETLSALPELGLDLVTDVATDPSRPFLFVWVAGADLGTVEEAMTEDPTVGGVDRYTELDGRALYRVQVSDDTAVVTYPDWVELGANLREATWEDGWWHVCLRVPDRESLGAVEAWCRERGVDFELDGVYADRGPTASADLTARQREVLVRAYELGYFDIPRRQTMAALAEDLDLSSQAVSERLRRAYRTLVAEYVL